DLVRDALLYDAHLRADRGSLQCHRHLHLAREVGVIERVGVDERLAGDEFQIGAPEGVAVSGGEVSKRHAVPAAFLRLELMNGACETEGWQPGRHSIGFDEGAKELLGLRDEDAVQLYRAGHPRDSLP